MVVSTVIGQATVEFVDSRLSRLVFDSDTSESGSFLSVEVATQQFSSWVEEFESLPVSEKLDRVYLGGTPFQISVWHALLQIPFGETTTYKEIANQVNAPRAYRAVGSAVGANPISLLIPCHRVLPVRGKVGNYRWGASRKSALLIAEDGANTSLKTLFASRT